MAQLTQDMAWPLAPCVDATAGWGQAEGGAAPHGGLWLPLPTHAQKSCALGHLPPPHSLS